MHIDNYPPFTMPAGVWITAAPTISTLHLPYEDVARLEGGARSDRASSCVFDGADGCLVLLREEEGDYDQDNLTPGTVALLDRFKALGYTHARFDSDGDIIEGLPTHNW